MSVPSDFSEAFSVTCPRCEARFSPSLRDTSYFARCPDCAEPVRVPAAAEVEDEYERARKLHSDVDTYRIALPPGFERSTDEVHFAAYRTEAKTPPKVREQPSRPKQDSERTPPSEAEESPEAVPPPATTRVDCPACGANFERPPSDRPQVVLCPECLEDVSLPALGSQPPPAPTETKPALAPGSDEAIAPRKGEAERSEGDAIGWDSYLEDAAKPPETEAVAPQKKRRKKTSSEPPIQPAENPTRREKLRKNVFDTMAEIRQVGEDPPPEWTFFSGVTDFLIRPEVAVRWAYASIGVCVMGWLIALCLHFYATALFALPFFVLPLIWIALMTMSYLAANSMVILLETAGGNDKVEGWPDPVMKEQAVDLVYLSFIMLVAQVCGFFVGGMLGVITGFGWTISLLLVFAVYPFILLSTLESNSPFVPVSLPILRSLKTLNWAWGVFYGLSGGLMLVWAWPVFWVLGQSGWTQFFAMIFLSPLIAGWCFLYGRLLGRLAWRVALDFPEEEDEAEKPEESPKRRRRKHKPSESSGELQSAR